MLVHPDPTNKKIMKTILKRMIAGVVITILASIFNACSPVLVATSRPHPVVYAPPPPPVEPVYASTLPPVPVQTVVVTPVIPVWAPPYIYVNEVHYYYFPDYMVYYDVFAQNYYYFDGYSWIHVITLPSIPIYSAFNPYSAYIVVMNRTTYQPWIRHDYYEQQYPSGYYNTMYAPRQTLGANTVLRAYDENQSRPMFIDKRSNKEVTVKYDVRNTPRSNAQVQNPRTIVNSNSTVKNNSTRSNTIENGSAQKPKTGMSSSDQVRTNSTVTNPGRNEASENAVKTRPSDNPRSTDFVKHQNNVSKNTVPSSGNKEVVTNNPRSHSQVNSEMPKQNSVKSEPIENKEGKNSRNEKNSGRKLK
jgi:hypothetical protein